MDRPSVGCSPYLILSSFLFSPRQLLPSIITEGGFASYKDRSDLYKVQVERFILNKTVRAVHIFLTIIRSETGISPLLSRFLVDSMKLFIGRDDRRERDAGQRRRAAIFARRAGRYVPGPAKSGRAAKKREEERKKKKKSRTGKRGKTAYVALPSSSRSCLIPVSVLLPSSCAVPRRRSPPHDAVMYSMARRSTIMRATTLLVRARVRANS